MFLERPKKMRLHKICSKIAVKFFKVGDTVEFINDEFKGLRRKGKIPYNIGHKGKITKISCSCLRIDNFLGLYANRFRKISS